MTRSNIQRKAEKWISVQDALPPLYGCYKVKYNLRLINPKAPDRETTARWIGRWVLGSCLEVTHWKSNA